MRVVDISSFFSDSCGGIKTYYRNKAHFLPALGVECHFVVPGRAATEERFGDAVMHRLPGPPLPFNASYRLFGARGAVVELLRRLAPDVIEVGSHYLLPAWAARAVAGLGAAAGTRPAIVGFFHSDIPRTLVEPAVAWLPQRLRAAAIEAAWRWVQRRHDGYRATLVASRRLAAALAARGVPRVRWVGLGVDVALFRPGAAGSPPAAGEPPVLAYAGRLSADKGFSLLLRAFPAIHAATGARLRVAGDGPQRKELLALAKRLPAASYAGCLQRPAEVAAFLGAADVVVTPGARETFSLATAEALACGTPVLAPDEGGAGELVGGSGGGALFAPDNAEALTAAAIGLLRMPPLTRAALGAQGRAHVEAQFSWPAVARRIADVYEEVR